MAVVGVQFVSRNDVTDDEEVFAEFRLDPRSNVVVLTLGQDTCVGHESMTQGVVVDRIDQRMVNETGMEVGVPMPEARVYTPKDGVKFLVALVGVRARSGGYSDARFIEE
jgi:hypothetical protein